MASTCRWCLSVGDGAAELLQSYCSGALSTEDQKAVNEDLCFCMECVVEYHKVREDFPALHKSLWDLETTRLMRRFDQASEADPEDDLFVVEDNQEFKVPKVTPAEYADLVRIPLLEILKYPYLLAHPKLSEMCVEVLSKMENSNSLQVYDKYPGIYLLLVHPNETVRRWAIGVARSLGNVDRDDFYDLQEIFSCMFFVVELGIFRNFQGFDSAYDPTTKMTTLPWHLYDSKNEKNYWLGICMLLTQLDTQAMDSLFLGPDKQANILQCILNTMEKELERDEDTDGDADPFWPALQCFMLILDRLGSRIWGQIEPTPAFQIITGSSSYMEEMENIKKMPWVKVEPVNDDDMVTCSQMVYDCNKDKSKEKNVRRSHGVDGSMVYEEMQSLVNVLQSDLGQAMRVHNSTFLWFIPFAKSVMDLDDLIYIHEVINYLCGEINSDFLNQRVRTCDKITEIFIRILVHIIDLHLKSGCLKRLYYCAPKWVEVVVKCATLPDEDFPGLYGPGTHLVSSTSSSRFTGSLMSASNRALSQACIPLIGSLLKEGSRLTTKSTSKYSHFLNLLNKQIRDGPQRQWNLTGSEVRDLQTCLQQLVKQLRDRPSGTDNLPAESLNVGPSPPPQTCPETSGSRSNIKEEASWDYCESNTHDGRNCSPAELGEKKEPLDATENCGTSAGDSRPPLQLSSLKPDIRKMQVLKSKLSEMMSKRPSAESSVGIEGLGREETRCLKPSSNSHTMRRESDSDEDQQMDNVPFSVLKNKLKKRDGVKSPQLPDISRPDSLRTNEDVIIILSEEDDDDDDCEPARKVLLKSEPSDVFNLNHSPLFDYNGDVSESQVFEFETEEDVVSAWANPGLENDVLPDQSRTREDFPVRPALNEPSTSWDDDTQPTSNENIERALQQAEEGIGKQKIAQGLKPAKVVQKRNFRNLLVEAKPLPKKVRGKKPKESETEAPKFTMPLPKKALPESNSIWIEREARPSSTSRAEREAQASAFSRPDPSTSTPAIVPPRKVRKAAEPQSSAERLGLKKKERKAFDLSQNSRDWVDKLRSHGQGVQVEQVAKKKHTKLTKKSKISRENMVMLGSKKKLLPPQDLQFLMQSRAKQQGAGAGTSAQPPDNKEPEPVENREFEPKRRVKPRALPLTDDEEDDDDEPLPCSQADPERNVSHSSLEKSNGTKPASPTTLTSDLFSTDRQTSKYCQENEVIFSRSGQAVGGGEEDDDWMQFTQMGALDMEMCSQMEEEEESFYTQRDPVDMDIDSDGQEPTEGAELSDKTSPLQADQNEGFKKPSTLPHTATPTQNDNCLFVKSGMSPITLKKAKPSTTKIYAPSSSRSASLVQEMEKTTKFSAAASFASGRGRSVRPMLPVRKPGALKPPLISQLDSLQMPPPKPPPPISLAPTWTAARPRLPPDIAPRLTSLQQPGNGLLRNPRALPSAPVQPGSNSSCIQAKPVPLSDLKTMLDRSTLIQHILNWTYDMFSNYEQYGVPLDLCAFPPEQVGCSFKSFDEYYKTFYPLLLINTFEELVDEWLKNEESGKGTNKNLRLIGNEFSKNTWNVSFEAGITPHEESHQLYPKEDDLVILTLPQNTGTYSEYEQQDLQTKHFGWVHKSSILSKDQSTTLSLIIKTHGNVTSVNQKPVHCKVVGSLINTLREFRALVSLYNSPMNRPLLAPHVSYFTCSEGAVPTLNLPGYNSDQVKAVRNGVSAVQNQTRSTKISLIHGPPGTGKSKTIVGLLTKLFSEGAHSMAPQLNNRKPRRLRVLLCAPSNAAIDNLMKKVILNFKERCRDLNSPQGNCGDINLVRLGNERAISKSLAAFSLDSQTKNRTQRAMPHSPDIHHRRAQLENSLDMISRKISSVRKDTLEYKQLMEQKARLASERQALSSELKQFHREDRQKRQATQTKVLHDAHIICCTLSTSGSMVLESAFRNLGHEPFNCVIVDEAGQATETETLIPMMYRCRSLVLVGDPEQLPPTVISKKAKELNYGQSLLARLCKCLRDIAGELSPVIFLSRQYRMHPDICEFPSKYIYKNQLKTDCDTAQKRCAVSWPFQSYWLFDVKDGREVKERESYRNDKEVRLVMLLLKLISGKHQGKVGVITPYNAQKERINREMAREENKHLQVEVDTVDGFQGREMDCIIVSCVRANHEGVVGFLGSKPRMNVTITRAKCSLFILGHLCTLKSDKDWGSLIDDASKRGTIMRTEEKNFKVDSRMILKKVFPSLDRPPASAGPRHVPISHRRTTVPALTTQPRGSSPPQRPRSVSPPHTADRPTDPRLATRPPSTHQQAPWPPPPPQQAPQPPAEILRDSRGVEPRRDAPIDGPRRGEHSRDPRLESTRDPRQEQGRDLRGENVHEYNHFRRYEKALPLRNRGRDMDRERDRHSSPGSLSYTGTYHNQRCSSPPSPKRKKK